MVTPAGAAPGQVAVTDARSAASISGPESPPPEPEPLLEPPELELLLEPPELELPLLDDLPPEDELLLDEPPLEDELLVDDPPLLDELLLDVDDPPLDELPLEVEEPLLLDDAPLEVEEPPLLDEPAPDDEEPLLELLVDVPPPSGVETVCASFDVPHAGSSNPTPTANNHGDPVRCPKTCVVSLRCMRFSLK